MFLVEFVCHMYVVRVLQLSAMSVLPSNCNLQRVIILN